LLVDEPAVSVDERIGDDPSRAWPRCWVDAHDLSAVINDKALAIVESIDAIATETLHDQMVPAAALPMRR
jgi:hypothetical protein